MKRPGIIVGLVVVAIAGIAVAHYTGIFPPKSGLEGTIGGAKRYQATQITDKDVVLADPQVQALLQSDLFHKVIATPEFKKLSQNQEFWQLLTTADFQKMVVLPVPTAERQGTLPVPTAERQVTVPKGDGLKSFGVQHPEFNQLIQSHDFLSLVQNRSFLQLVANDQFQKLASMPDEIGRAHV